MYNFNFNSLGDHFKEDKDIIIAKMDSTQNELSDITISSFPTIKYFPLDSDEIIDYNGNRNFESLMKFVESDGKDGQISDSESSDDDNNPIHAHEDL